MRRFIITSTKFTGQVELTYGTNDIITSIVFIDCSFTANAMQKILIIFSATAHVADLATQLKQYDQLVVVEKSCRISFEEWWNKYNKKINKLRCIPLFEALNDAETVLATEGIKPYDKFLAEAKVRQKLDPENYLKQKSWMNQWK